MQKGAAEAMGTARRLLVLLSAVTLASQDHLPGSCVFEGRTVPDGGHVTKSDPCHLCHCHGGRLECVWKHCGPPPPRCRTIETDNGCNKTVYLCPLPGDNSREDKTTPSASSEWTTQATIGPYFPPLSSSSPSSGGETLLFPFSLLPPPLPSLSPLLEGRESTSGGPGISDQPRATYFSEFSSAPMNFSAILSRGEGPRSPRRLALREPSEEETGRSSSLRFSSQRPWEAGWPDERNGDKSSQKITERTTERTRKRPTPRSSFRVSRRPISLSDTQTAPGIASQNSADNFARTTSRATTRVTTRTTPRTKTWTTSRTTVHNPPQFTERNYPKPRLRFPKRPSSLSIARGRTPIDREYEQETTTQHPVRRSGLDLIRASQHPIVRPRIRPLSVAQPSKLVRTTVRPEKSTTSAVKPRRATTARPGRRQQKTLSITRHRLQRLFPSIARPEAEASAKEPTSQGRDLTTVGPETTAVSTRQRVRPLPTFQSDAPARPLPRPRSRSPSSSSSRSRSASFSASIPSSDDPSSFPSFEQASSRVLVSGDDSAPLERVPPFPSVPAAVPLAAPVVSFDYDLEDDSIDLSEYEFPEFGRRLRRDARVRETDIGEENVGGATKNSELNARGTRMKDRSLKDRGRRSLLPGDERSGNGHRGHGHGHGHSGQHPHYPDGRTSHDPDTHREDRRSHHSNNRHTLHQLDHHRSKDALPSRDQLGAYRGIGAKNFEGVLQLASHRPEETGDKEDKDLKGHQLLSSGRDSSTSCFVSGTRFQLGEVIEAASGSCLECRCAGAAMLCYPKCCFYSTEEPRAGHAVHVTV